MSQPRTRNLGATAALTVLAIACAAFIMGFYVLPQATSQGSVWARLCRAAGVVTAGDPDSSLAAAVGFTHVVLPRAAMDVGSARQIGRGATLALRCTSCHGARGVSGADAPNLAGKHPEVIYK